MCGEGERNADKTLMFVGGSIIQILTTVPQFGDFYSIELII